MDQPPEFLARHEAQHAVVGLQIGVRLRWVEIGDGEGETVVTFRDDWSAAVMSAAPTVLSAADADQVMRLVGGNRFAQARAEGKALVTAQGAAVDRVAAALLERRFLTGREVRELVG